MVRWGSVVGPLFQFGDGSVSDSFPFCGSRAVCVAAGGALLLIRMCQYSGHSFGIGAELCGIQDSLIKTLGQWQSSAYTVYVQTPREVLQGVANRLCA